MSRVTASKTDSSSYSTDPAARLADYSGNEYFFISGRAAGEMSGAPVTGSELGAINLPPDNVCSDSVDSDTESVSTPHRPEHKELTKVDRQCFIVWHSGTAIFWFCRSERSCYCGL